jgi:hypothetical protein
MRAPKDGTPEPGSVLGGVPAPRLSTFGSATIATIYFARDLWLMDSAGFGVAQKLADKLAFMAKPLVSVDGYASAEGPSQHNDELAQSRRDGAIAVLSSKRSGLTFLGRGHGAADPAVPETATDPTELETQRAHNRRVEIVITDMTAPAPPVAPKPTVDVTKPAGDITKVPPPPPKSPEEEAKEQAEENLNRILKLPPDLGGPPKRSFSDEFWKSFDEGLEKTMSKVGVPKQFRGLVKDGAHALVEKGAESALDSALDAAHASPQQKEAVKAAVKAAAATKL